MPRPTGSVAKAPQVPPSPPDCSTVFRPSFDLNLKVTLMWVKTSQSRGGVRWWATESPEGSASLAFRPIGGEVIADAWGPGAAWAIERLPALLGGDDDTSGFRPRDPVVSGLVSRMGVPRLGATGRWYEAMATAAIYQRVVSADARTAVTRMGRMHGTDVPGGGPLPLFPCPEAVLRVPDHGFHRAGVDRARSRVIRVAAKHAERLEALHQRPAAEAREWLQRLPGVGPWTAARTTGAAAGDPDAVPVGDLHVPVLVTYALSGAPDGDDDSMLELLEPYAGHRGRVVRLIKAAGIGPPKHHPAPTRFDISRI
ncbi:MAG: DNA-3-methyladenine glycosylase 2 family protein [Acidimicrobiaceae bacterium]|nr:DNA-3-methyladenine glycosylase 2 family protein [Acidimicrobiaceae bacterium]MYE66365.1 DNA-3-methyladenine glycosylase 2 family protein [Acidimicrobiaceae bacterium]